MHPRRVTGPLQRPLFLPAPRRATSYSLNCRALPSREIVPQSGFDPLQRPVDLIAGDHKWRADADRVFMGILGKDPPALERLTIATRPGEVRPPASARAPAPHGSYLSGRFSCH